MNYITLTKTKMLFPREFLHGYEDFEGQEYNEIETKFIDKRRWVSTYRDIFKFNDKFYAYYYERPNSETQEGSEAEEEDMIECDEVFAKIKTITVYE